MRRAYVGLGTILLLTFVTACDSGTDADDIQRFDAELSGGAEVPPVTTTSSGTAEFIFDEDDDELHFTVDVNDVDLAIQSHIHIAPEGVNGPVVVFLFGPVEGGVDVDGNLATGTITEDELIPNDDFDGTLESLIEAMQEGNAYVNVHTVAHPAGEIRGQIETAP